MKVDNYTKIILTIIAFSLITLCFSFLKDNLIKPAYANSSKIGLYQIEGMWDAGHNFPRMFILNTTNGQVHVCSGRATGNVSKKEWKRMSCNGTMLP